MTDDALNPPPLNVATTHVWQVVEGEREIRISLGKMVTIQVYGVRRADDFSLIREEIERERHETFCCSGSFGQFKFFASRWDILKNQPKDCYIVYVDIPVLDSNRKNWANPSLCRIHARDIESALLHFPVRSPFFQGKRVNRVIFELTEGKARKTVSSEDL